MMRGRKLKRPRRSSAAAAMATTSRAGDLTLHLERISLLPLPLPLPSSRFQKILDCDELPDAIDGDDKDCILSQDLFCLFKTPRTSLTMQIGYGNFSHVFKVLNRLDDCMYAVKQCIRQLHHDVERRHALMEVQALASLGSHENVVGYHTSWFENHQLYIQMELCERSLSIDRDYIPNDAQVLEVLNQMAKALHFIHERGIAHLDVKPDNIYVKNNTYKLGDFGCATRIDRSLPIEEGDSRYMPQEMLNDQYEHLDKIDIFSLGAAIYELVKGSPLPDSRPQFSYIREGRLPLLPGHSMQFQALLKAMMSPDPMKRPSAKEIMENPIFEKARRGSRC